MSSGLSVGEQLAGMLNMLRFGDPNWTSSTGEVSLMSLVWPLLPLLPPQPPPLLTELMRDGDRTDRTTKEKCCMCGKPGKNFVSRSCENTPSPNAAYSSGIELRQRSVLPKRPSLDRMVDAIEHKVEEKLNSIEQMTVRNNELDRQKRELYESGNSMNDAELLNRLQCLVKKKQTHEQRLKELETKKQKMEDSLITAITLAKGIEPKGQSKTVNFRTHDKPIFDPIGLKPSNNKHNKSILAARNLSEDDNINAEIEEYDEGVHYQDRHVSEDDIPITERALNFDMFKDIAKDGANLLNNLNTIKDKSKQIAKEINEQIIEKDGANVIDQLTSIKDKGIGIGKEIAKEMNIKDGKDLIDKLKPIKDIGIDIGKEIGSKDGDDLLKSIKDKTKEIGKNHGDDVINALTSIKDLDK